jgi:hypothetical protein
MARESITRYEAQMEEEKSSRLSRNKIASY